MSSLDRVCKEIQAAVREVEGLDLVPDYAMDAINVGSLLLVYPDNGSWQPGSPTDRNEPNVCWGVHTIKIRLHVLRQDLPSSMQKVLSFSDTIPKALLHAYAATTFNDSIICLGDYNNPAPGNRITYQFDPNVVGGTQTLTWTFSMTVSVEEEYPS